MSVLEEYRYAELEETLPDGMPFAEGHVVKDCSCVIHEGPHYLHLDTLAKARNREVFDRLRSRPKCRDAFDLMERKAAWHAWGEEEQQRLEEKLEGALQYQRLMARREENLRGLA